MVGVDGVDGAICRSGILRDVEAIGEGWLSAWLTFLT
jgi:hypothetical protein